MSNNETHNHRDEVSSGGTITIEIASSIEEMERHATQWNLLAYDSPQQLPMLSHAWIASYVEHCLQPDSEVRCLLAYEDKQLVGVLPLLMGPKKVFGLKQTCFGLPEDDHTTSVDILAAREKEQVVTKAFLDSLETIDAGWFVAEFPRLPDCSPLIKYLSQSGGKHVCVVSPFEAGAYLPTVGDYEEYRAGLSKKFRTALNQCANRLNRLNAPSIELLEGNEATEKDFERFMEIEASGWKGREGTAISQSPKLIDFYSSLVRRSSENGLLAWQFLTADGKTIAGNLALRCRRSLTIWKLGYDENYARLSPGTILTNAVIKRAFESKEIEKIELVTDPRWSQNWRMQLRDYYSVSIYPQKLMPRITSWAPKRTTMMLRRIPFLRSTINRVRRLIGQDT